MLGRSSQRFVQVSDDVINSFPITTYVGISSNNLEKLEYFKNDSLELQEGLNLGELGYDIEFYKLMVSTDRKTIKLKGIIRDYQTSEVWKGINVFTARELNSTNNKRKKSIEIINITNTDSLGNFELTSDFHPDTKLYVSYLGYQTYEVDIGTIK